MKFDLGSNLISAVFGAVVALIINGFWHLTKRGSSLIWRRVKRRNDLHNGSFHEDCIIVASGFPLISPDNIRVRMDNSFDFFFSLPSQYRGIISESENYHRSDEIPFAISAGNVSDMMISETLSQAKEKVAKCFYEKREGCNFNGAMVGIKSIDSLARTVNGTEDPILDIQLFRTDYYTHRVAEELRNRLGIDETAVDFDFLHNIGNSWLRSSLGLSIIVILKCSNEIILTKRSKNVAYSEGKEWIYVSATETFSETDYDIYSKQFDLQLCLLRGLSEELGIDRHMVELSSIRFYDSFFEKQFFQDNVVASVEIKEKYSFDSVAELRGKDKPIEVSDMWTIPNTKKDIDYYIDRHKSEMRAQTIFSLRSYASMNF